MAQSAVLVKRPGTDVVIEAVQQGDGSETVVCIPSALRGAADFTQLADQLEANGIRCVAINPRGAGRSKGPVEGLTLHDLADDFAAVIEQLCDRPVHLVGHALGNSFARCTAADYSDLVASVTLLGAGPYPRFTPGPNPRAAAGLARMADPDAPESERLAHIQGFFAEGNDPTVWSDGWWPGSAPLVTALFATEPEDFWTAGHTAPVLVVQPLEDVLPSDAAYALVAELGTRGRVLEVAHCSHAMLPEQPEIINQAIIDFVGEHPAPTT